MAQFGQKLKEQIQKDTKNKETVAILLSLAREYKKVGNYSNTLAASMLYSGIAEYMGRAIIQLVEFEINRKALDDSFSSLFFINVNEEKGSKKKTNLESTIILMENYSFLYKSSISTLLRNIRDNRNRIMHNLITGKSKGINLALCHNVLAKDTEELLKIYIKLNEYLKEVKKPS